MDQATVSVKCEECGTEFETLYLSTEPNDVLPVDVCSPDCEEAWLEKNVAKKQAEKREALKQQIITLFIDNGRIYTGEGVETLLDVTLEVIDEIIADKKKLNFDSKLWEGLKNKVAQTHIKVHDYLVVENGE